MYDIVITGASILDGTGTASFSADVAITGSKIVKIAPALYHGNSTRKALPGSYPRWMILKSVKGSNPGQQKNKVQL